MSNDDASPPPVHSEPPPGPRRSEDESASTRLVNSLIPAKNTDSLVSYYLGLFSIIPCFGLPMGAVAMWFGRRAFKAVKENPVVAGKMHAVVGMGCGAIGFLFNLLIVIFLVLVFVGHGRI